jgi:hypothetical protein
MKNKLRFKKYRIHIEGVINNNLDPSVEGVL